MPALAFVRQSAGRDSYPRLQILKLRWNHQCAARQQKALLKFNANGQERIAVSCRGGPPAAEVRTSEIQVNQPVCNLCPVENHYPRTGPRRAEKRLAVVKLIAFRRARRAAFG